MAEQKSMIMSFTFDANSVFCDTVKTALEKVCEEGKIAGSLAARDELQKKLASVHKGCPRTNVKAYSQAQKALKENEESTFSDEEIDKLLPTK